MAAVKRKSEFVLFDRLEHYLLTTRCYRDSHLDRRDLAAALSTNETYLFNAVRIARGTTLLQYIYNLRLKEAAFMLLDTPELTIEQVAGLCGFNSVRTFYRHFRTVYGVTPDVYRRKEVGD